MQSFILKLDNESNVELYSDVDRGIADTIVLEAVKLAVLPDLGKEETDDINEENSDSKFVNVVNMIVGILEDEDETKRVMEEELEGNEEVEESDSDEPVVDVIEKEIEEDNEEEELPVDEIEEEEDPGIELTELVTEKLDFAIAALLKCNTINDLVVVGNFLFFKEKDPKGLQYSSNTYNETLVFTVSN